MIEQIIHQVNLENIKIALFLCISNVCLRSSKNGRIIRFAYYTNNIRISSRRTANGFNKTHSLPCFIKY